MKENGRNKTHWIYFRQIFDSKFQASCLKAKIEENWHNGYELPPWVEIRKLKDERYVVRYTFDE
ncbi:hypothetical protein [Texcoconibacillus texcoconensis]|uniref:Uncharacterized protein n=1 Tax=Texcoconibacillus texcoconensis TaxID=1095777 RepID=A0A840QLN9_9BACI|nr:hypothetical protein [Texcoconibacillus texcoconensis]MBB5172271.1 hypothetical protein [Texcoconibacillus texcoconensis]